MSHREESKTNEETTSGTTSTTTGPETTGENAVDAKVETKTKLSRTPEVHSEARTVETKTTEAKEESGVELEVGHVMTYERTKRKYKLLSQIHCSSVSTVFKVRPVPPGKNKNEVFAMKVEKIAVSDFLRLDLNVMDEVSHHKEQYPSLVIALPHLIDFGMTEGLRSLIMPCYWTNLHDLRKNVLKKGIMIKSALRLNTLTLNAITALHRLDFVHGNICLRNYMLDMDRHSVRLIDFSSGRFNKNDFRKTNIDQIFASRNVMREQPPKIHDDIESWIFVCFDLIMPKLLRWHELDTLADVIRAKDSFLLKPMAEQKQNPEAYKILPPVYKRLGLVFMSMQNDATIDHARFYNLVNEPLVKMNIKSAEPFEWEPAYAQKAKKVVKKEKPKRPSNESVEKVQAKSIRTAVDDDSDSSEVGDRPAKGAAKKKAEKGKSKDEKKKPKKPAKKKAELPKKASKSKKKEEEEEEDE